jgi:PHD/YefM family antitoxin component YafN of YafNO toxin-antitoxin module
MNQLITLEDFTSVQELQSGVTKVFERAAKSGKFLRVMRNQKPLGVLIPNQVWEDIMEDNEASLSPNYIKRIEQARNDKVTYSATEVKKMLKLK